MALFLSILLLVRSFLFLSSYRFVQIVVAVCVYHNNRYNLRIFECGGKMKIESEKEEKIDNFEYVNALSSPFFAFFPSTFFLRVPSTSPSS
jgi:hypothetical protein